MSQAVLPVFSVALPLHVDAGVALQGSPFSLRRGLAFRSAGPRRCAQVWAPVRPRDRDRETGGRTILQTFFDVDILGGKLFFKAKDF